MKRSAQILFCAALGLSSIACTKQNSQQNDVDSRQTDARRDISGGQGTVASPDNETGKEPITTNPNSARQGTDSTLDTSRGAVVVGDSNLNPRAEGPGANTPTSVDQSVNQGEPKTDAAVQQANCQDTKPGTSCPPTSVNPISRESTTGDLPEKPVR